MKFVKKAAYTLIIIGGLNWGLVGFFAFDLVETLLGSMSMAARLVYGLVGLSALFMIFMHKSGCNCACDCKSCGVSGDTK